MRGLKPRPGKQGTPRKRWSKSGGFSFNPPLDHACAHTIKKQHTRLKPARYSGFQRVWRTFTRGGVRWGGVVVRHAPSPLLWRCTFHPAPFSLLSVVIAMYPSLNE